MKLDDRNPMTSADVLITIEGVPGYFSEFSGVKKNVSRPDYSDGLNAIKRKAGSGTISFDDITIAKAFDPEKDGDLVLWCDRMMQSIDTQDITLRPVKRDGGVAQRGSKAWNINGRVSTYSTMESMDTNDGGSVAKMAITFSVDYANWA